MLPQEDGEQRKETETGASAGSFGDAILKYALR